MSRGKEQGRQRVTLRLDNNLDLLLRELADKHGTNISTLIRMFCRKCIDDMQDKDGEWL